MKVEVWNCRGLGQRLTVRRLKEIQRVYLPHLLFLIETKQKSDYVRDIGVQLGYEEMCIVPPRGLSGGLVVFWKNVVSVQVISFDSRIVDMFVEYKAFQFYLSCIYGHPIPKERHHLWEKLQRISTQRTCPWMICGDFNEILDQKEKRGGRVRNDSGFKSFRLMTQVCGMEDLKSKGNPFSWVGRRRQEIIECCLDRVMVNGEWRNSYRESENEFLELAESDHRPMIVSIAYEQNARRGQFRYNKRLFLQEDFVDTVKRSWSGGTSYQNQYTEKLAKCRIAMARWKRRHKKNSAEKIQLLRRRIDTALRDIRYSTEEINEMRRELNKTYLDEENYWKHKSRNCWLLCGDRNTRFFHGSTKAKRKRNCIKQLVDDFGISHKKEEAMGKVAEEYFEKMFTTSCSDTAESESIQLKKTVTDEMNRCLTALVTDKEIKHAIFQIDPNRAPGADGYSSAFYQQFWPEIEVDVCNMVKKFFEEGVLEPGINHTQICLIPKITNAMRMSDFRLISLCTISYKIISKILMLRLKNCLSELISENQAAFVPGRNITDNVLVAHELVSSLKSKKDCVEK